MQNLIADAALMSPLLSDSPFEMADSRLPSSDPDSISPLQLLPFDFAPLNAAPASSNTFESDLPISAHFSIDSNSLIDGAIPIGNHTALPTLPALPVETLNAGSGNTVDSSLPASASEPATPSNAASTTPADLVNSNGANPANPTISSPATTATHTTITKSAAKPATKTHTTITHGAKKTAPAKTPKTAAPNHFTSHPTIAGGAVHLPPKTDGGSHRSATGSGSNAAPSGALTPDASPQQITDLFGTGQDYNHSPLPDGTGDGHYSSSSGAVVVNSKLPDGWVGNTGNAKWISKVADQSQAGAESGDPQSYYYSTSFTIVGGSDYDIAKTDIEAQITGDDTVTQVYLNGTDVGYSGNGENDYQSLHSLVIDGSQNSSLNFQTGTNSLAFIVTNHNSTGNNPTGLLVDFTKAVVPVAKTLKAVDDSDEIVVNETKTIDVLGNDTYGSNVHVSIPDNNFSFGSTSVSSDNKISYVSDGAAGQETFQYQITDDSHETSTAYVTIDIAPFEAYSDSESTVVNGNVQISVLDNDDYPDDDNVTVTIPEDAQPTLGSAYVNSDNSITYTAFAVSGTDTFEYVLGDDYENSSTATVTVTISDFKANDDSAEVYTHDSVEIPVLDNDVYSYDTVTVVPPEGNPQFGSVTLDPYSNVFTYTNYGSGGGQTDSFSYEITDNFGNSSYATVYVDITQYQAVDDSSQTNTGGTVIIDVLQNDEYFSETNTTVGIYAPPSNGTANRNDDNTITYKNNGTACTDTFVYEIFDGHGNDSTATVTVDVTAPPISVDFSINGTSDHADDVGFIGVSLSVTMTLNDPSLDQGESEYVDIELPAGGSYPSVLSFANVTEYGLDENSDPTAYQDVLGEKIHMQLTNGEESSPIYVTALQPSETADDIVMTAYATDEQGAQYVSFQTTSGGSDPVKFGDGKGSGVRVWIGSGTTADVPADPDADLAANGAKSKVKHIFNLNTPDAMQQDGKYRIPPRVDSGYWVKEKGAIADGESIYAVILNVGGVDSQNGKVELKSIEGQWLSPGKTQIEIKGSYFNANGGIYEGNISGKVDANGKAIQTIPGFAGNLKIAICNIANDDPVNATNTGVKSDGFSVAAIPIAINFTSGDTI